MIENSALVLILGIAIGFMIALILGLVIFSYYSIIKQFKELFKRLKCLK